MPALPHYRRGWQFKDGKLILFEPRSITVLRGWPQPLAWRKTPHRAWRHVRPQFSINIIKYVASGADVRAFLRGEFALSPALRRPKQPRSQRHFAFDSTPWERMEAGLERRTDAARQFLATIPVNIQRLVAAFGERQWHILVLLARVHGAEDLVRSAPALAWAIASNWVFHKPAVKKPVRAMRRLVRIRRREAAAWLGFPGTESAARTLCRIKPGHVGVALLCDLRRCLHDEEASRWLRHLPHPTRGALGLLAARNLRPHVSMPLLLDVSRTRAWARRPRAYGTLRDTIEMATRLERRLPRFRSIAQLSRWHDDLVEELNLGRNAMYLHYRFPAPPIAGSDDVRPLDCAKELISEGQSMRHCVATLAPAIARGTSYVYRVLEPERATLELTRHGSRWRIASLLGPRNAPVEGDTRDSVHRWLAQGSSPSRLEPEWTGWD